ncbi:MAG: hypothetical protein OXF72_11370 [Gammaproteobacteria bacterium]|nr:hypothetical protein [Gammaproteobacteria bacterium]MCY4277101.1 hypothetical protein [Gammaproteobacteria bacterium]MCY4323122.1 hypothetical protein [Gammaproteobacteria bacterium]
MAFWESQESEWAILPPISKDPWLLTVTNDVQEKAFDCVKWTRERRDQMYEEEMKWRAPRRPKDPMLAKLFDRAKAPPDCRWRDQGDHIVQGRKETQLIVEITLNESLGGYAASALAGSIRARGNTVEEVRTNTMAAVDSYLKSTDPLPRPKFIRLRFLRDEVIEA